MQTTNNNQDDRCRCGWAPNQHREHTCHGKFYRCGKIGKRRFYNAKIVALAGMQTKMEVQETWACDDCWAEFVGMSSARLSVHT